MSDQVLVRTRPFNTTNNLLEYTVEPGTYDFRIVDPADADALFPSLTAGQLSQIFTAWTFNSPWITDYLVFDSTAASNPNLSQKFTGAFSPALASNPAAAYNAAISGGYFNQIILGATNSGNVQTQFQFAQPETLIFAVPDYFLPDNNGGVSVLISPSGAAVPEPGSLLMAASGVAVIALFCGRLRRRHNHPYHSAGQA